MLRITIDVDETRIRRWGFFNFAVRPSALPQHNGFNIPSCDNPEHILPGFEYDTPADSEGPVFSFRCTRQDTKGE